MEVCIELYMQRTSSSMIIVLLLAFRNQDVVELIGHVDTLAVVQRLVLESRQIFGTSAAGGFASSVYTHQSAHVSLAFRCGRPRGKTAVRDCAVHFGKGRSSRK